MRSRAIRYEPTVSKLKELIFNFFFHTQAYLSPKKPPTGLYICKLLKQIFLNDTISLMSLISLNFCIYNTIKREMHLYTCLPCNVEKRINATQIEKWFSIYVKQL